MWGRHQHMEARGLQTGVEFSSILTCTIQVLPVEQSPNPDHTQTEHRRYCP